MADVDSLDGVVIMFVTGRGCSRVDLGALSQVVSFDASPILLATLIKRLAQETPGVCHPFREDIVDGHGDWIVEPASRI